MSIIVHHLEYSRSTRILWLLEELGLPYELVRHPRDPKTFRAPQALKDAHPLAKAPTVVIDGHVMVESGAIIEYLVEAKGGGRLAPTPGSPRRAAFLEWNHFVEGTMAMPVIMVLLSPRFGGLGEGMGPFLLDEASKLLDYADAHLAKHDFLTGEEFSAADINLAYVLEVASAGRLLKGRSALRRYLDRMLDRPAYKKAIEVGGPVVLPIMQDEA